MNRLTASPDMSEPDTLEPDTLGSDTLEPGMPDNNTITDIKDLTHAQLTDWFTSRGMSSYRANQIFKWVYLCQTDDFERMTDLSKPLREQLASHFVVRRLHKARVESSVDGSKKYLFRLVDGFFIETVLIPEKDHYTLCISTQVGCAQGCRFCLTAKSGFHRNLTQGEIIAQVRDIANELSADDPKRLTNIVLMGMGEPLANYTAVINALNILTDSDRGMKFSTRRITISTAGVAPMLERLGRDTEINLAISLNATDNKTRNLLMPINERYPLEVLLEACRAYPLKPRRRITFEYILMKDVNDSLEDARRLMKLLSTVRGKINLIPFNEYEGSPFKRPDESRIYEFREYIANRHFTIMTRYSKGTDISAACGQLKAEYIEE